MGNTNIEFMVGSELIKTAVQCMTQISIEKERELTERERIRAQAEVCIEKIRADLAKDLHIINMEHLQRMELINQICKCCGDKDLTEREFLICRDILELLKIEAVNKQPTYQQNYEIPTKFLR